MKYFLPLAAVCMLVASCTTPEDTMLTDVADLPLQTTSLPSWDWQNAPMRANAQYIMYGAKNGKELRDCVGDYYIVRWYDARPKEPVRVVMHYTQAATGSAKQVREIRYDAPRDSAGARTTDFFFTGEDRARAGDVLTWKFDLYSGGKLKDTRRSYLWRESPMDPVVPKK